MFGPKDKDNKWAKDQWYKMPHYGKFRKVIIKFVMMLRPMLQQYTSFKNIF